MSDPAATPSHFDELIGLKVVEATPDGVTATFEITPQLQQPYGILHGGVLCTVVESVGSISGAVWSGGGVVGTSNHTNFIKAARSGTLTARSTPIQRGRTQQLWNVDITDESGRLIATGQLRLANITDTARIGTT
jgi:1,4-dihydroxy-2-naphthoyl-CoA hydrolase